MNKTDSPTAPARAADDDLSTVDAHLGKVLVLIHRVLPRLDELPRASEVQALLAKAAKFLESARAAHEHETAARSGAGVPAQRVATGVEPEIAAVIAAAVSVLFDRPYRLVSVQQVATPVPHLNVWALEGRTQIFQSHKIR